MSRIPTLLGALITIGCGPGPLAPSRTGGELLPGTREVAYLGGRPFSVSPDHRWLIFLKDDPSERERPVDLVELQIARLAAYVLYDLERATPIPVGVADDVVDLVGSGGEPLLDGGCWIETEDARLVVLRDSFGRFVGIDPAAPEPTWTQVALDRAGYAAACPESDRYRPPSEPVGPFLIAGAATRRLRISDANDPDRAYATHRAGLLATGLQISDIHLSPDGRHLAYTVTPTLGSFVSNARAFVIDADDPIGSPTPLASPIFAVRWAPDGSALYAAVRTDGEMAIHRWTMDR